MIDINTIKELGFQKITTPKDNNIAVITIIGEVEGHDALPSNVKSTKYEHLIPLITGLIYDNEIDALLFILHTTGGDVDAGLAIAELISSITKPTLSLTLGTSHSIGIPIAVAANHSMITRSGLMLAHPIRMTGTTIGAAQSYEYIDRLQNRITEFIVAHSKITKDKFNELVFNKKDLTQDVGSMINSSDTVKSGLIDSVGGLSEAVNRLDELITHKSQN